MTKNKIRQLLIDKHCFTNIVLDNYPKKQDLIDLLESSDKQIEEVKNRDNKNNKNNKNKEKETKKDKSIKMNIPKDLTPNSPEWTQYVLSHFEDDELEGKNPKVDGLRRVTELLLGEIVEEGCNLIASPTTDNEMRACVKAWIVVKSNGNTKRHEALADAYTGNCTEKFNMYITALADTRAKGRCFRNALRLKQVIAAEESQSTIGDVYTPNNGKIDQGQIKAINLLCERNNLVLKDILDSLDLKYDIDDGLNINLSELENKHGRAILQVINKINTTKEEK